MIRALAIHLMLLVGFMLAGLLLRALKGGWWPFGVPQQGKGGRAALLYGAGNAVLLAALAAVQYQDWLLGLIVLPLAFAVYFVPGRWLPHNPGQQMTAWWHPLQLSAEGYLEALGPLLLVGLGLTHTGLAALALLALPGLLVGPLYLAGRMGPFVWARHLWFAFPSGRLFGAYLIDWWTGWGERLPGLWLLGTPAALLLFA